MACVALASLMGTIELEFLKPNHRVCVDDEKPLNSLFQKLSSLKEFLVKEYYNGGAPNRDVEIKIRDFALRAEDAIELQLRNILVAKHKEHQHTAHGELHQILQEVGKDAEDLLDIINNNTSSNEVEAGNDSFPLTRWSEPDNILSGGSFECAPKLQDIIRRRLIIIDDRYTQERVISIFGVPGVGKTTLCKRLYTDEGVVSYFDIRGWVTIPPPRQCNVQQVLCGLLQSLRPTIVNFEIDMENTTVSQLKEQLHKHLKGKRYLIVLDDVCNTLLWSDIQPCFPDDSNRSRILLTTRFAGCLRPERYYMRFLIEKKSWEVFCNRLSLKHYMAPEFEEIAKRLVKECQGLPRSIVMVAHRLSKCNYTLKEWKKVEKELLSLGTLHADAQHSSKLTEMYNQLPQHLKVCFLYFAVFPKASSMWVDRLVRLWIAEGFVKPVKDVPLENIAFSYLGATTVKASKTWGYVYARISRHG